ncbi:MAG: HupE/UreJ family protein [Acidobacteria bacterium]|nr:HupE/UreJ family protein [Acidobacteriota bacterium]
MGLIGLAAAMPAAAHPVPFSYVDVQVRGTAIEVAVVAHAYDLAHDLGLDVGMADTLLLDPVILRRQATAIAALVGGRLTLRADGVTLRPGAWSMPEAIADRASVRVRATYSATSAPGVLTITADFFPYDSQHQTFVNVYETGELRTQAILGNGRHDLDYFTGSRQGAWAVVRKFVPSGVHHILIGPDHILFLVGLLLLGGTVRRLAVVVTGFTLAHSITLSLAALNVVNPPATVIEPAIALSIVYVGIDNLLVRGGRDVRAWIAFGFGFIHGFGFANVLREMDLPARALGWSLGSFNVGVEIGQLIIVVPVAAALGALRARSAPAARLVAVAGSAVVIAAGAFWFVQRVFFPGGAT